MKVGKSLFLFLLLSFAFHVASAQDGNWASFADTDWFTLNPDEKNFELSNAEELAGLALLVNQGHTFKDTVFVLTADIDLGSHYWTPAASRDTYKTSVFCGVFNGSGKVIKGLYIKDKLYSGLFGYVGDGAKIEHLRLEGGHIIGIVISTYYYSGENAYTGGLIGMGECKLPQDSIVIRDCHTKDIQIKSAMLGGKWCYTGGIIGYLSSTGSGSLITGCSNNGEIATPYYDNWKSTASHATGGIGGHIIGATLSFCQNFGVISNSVPQNTPLSGAAGGIVGRIETSNISFCQNRGNVSGASGGGIVGTLNPPKNTQTTITNCYNDGILSSIYCYGIVASINLIEEPTDECGVTISNCYHVLYDSEQYKGANSLIGEIKGVGEFPVEIENCYMVNFEDSHFYAYEFVGNIKPESNVSISNCLAVSSNPNFRLADPSNSNITFSGNYTYINGLPIGDDNDSNGHLGGEWLGEMTTAPFNQWDTDIWEIDHTGQYMPLLKGFDNQAKVLNPLYEMPLEYYTITLPEVEHGVLNYEKGNYKVRAGSDFVFTITPDKGYELDKASVTDQDGNPLAHYKNYSQKKDYFILNNVNRNTQILIGGISMGIESLPPDGSRVWSSNGAICVSVPTPQLVTIYTIQGQLVAKKQVNSEDSISLSPGLYVVKVGSTTYKVVL